MLSCSARLLSISDLRSRKRGSRNRSGFWGTGRALWDMGRCEWRRRPGFADGSPMRASVALSPRDTPQPKRAPGARTKCHQTATGGVQLVALGALTA